MMPIRAALSASTFTRKPSAWLNNIAGIRRRGGYVVGYGSTASMRYSYEYHDAIDAHVATEADAVALGVDVIMDDVKPRWLRYE